MRVRQVAVSHAPADVDPPPPALNCLAFCAHSYYSLEYSCKTPLEQPEPYLAPGPFVNQPQTPTPCQSNPNLRLKVAGWKPWAYTDGSCQVQDGKTVIGAGVYHPMSDEKNLVEPNGAGITNTIGRAELAAIAAALTHKYAQVATDSLSSPHQLEK
eukprot:1142193-Pelagomonas_calceolata.AAC.2